jgi:hypothetical protein
MTHQMLVEGIEIDKLTPIIMFGQNLRQISNHPLRLEAGR